MRTRLLLFCLLGGYGPAAWAQQALVVDQSSDAVSVLNTATNAVVANIPVGSRPYKVAFTPDGTRAYVTVADANAVVEVNPATASVITSIPTPQPYAIAITPDGTRAYVTNESANTVAVILLATNAVIATVPVGPSPIGVAITPNGQRAYVTSFDGNFVSVIDTASNTVVSSVTVGKDSEGVAISPDGSRVYVAVFYTNNVAVINTATNAVTAMIPMPDGPVAVALKRDGTRAYVANFLTNTVAVIDTATNMVIATIPVPPYPSDLAITPDGRRLLVTEFDESSVSVIDTQTNTVIGSIPVLQNPNGIAVSPVSATPNRPPVARCTDRTVPAGPNCTATASVDAGSSDPDPGDTITLTQFPAGPYLKGSTSVTLTATDSRGLTSSCQAMVTVLDQTPPTFVGVPTVSVGTEVNATSCVAPVYYFGQIYVVENCNAYTLSGPAPGMVFPVGTSHITLTATDSSGNQTSTQQTIRVIDNAPPVISSASVDKPVLSPTHQLVPVTVTYGNSDNCSANSCTLSVSSSESGTAAGTDWTVVDSHHVLLRAESFGTGTGTGRVYTVVIRCVDNSGNVATQALTVRVASGS